MRDLFAMRNFKAFVMLVMLFQWTIIVKSQQKAAEPEPLPLEQHQDIQCRIGNSSYRRQLYLNFGFRSNAEAQDIVEEVIRVAGLLAGAVSARAAEVGNAEACRANDGRDYVLYNPVWLSAVYNDSDEYWADRAIIAHEVGHIWHNDVLRALGSNRAIELQADEFAGNILARLGATLSQAESAYRSNRMRTPHNSSTYPSTEDRLTAVERGWRSYARRDTESSNSYPHLIRTASGGWKPEPGYVWVNIDSASDLSVRWKAGTSYPLKPHVSACAAENQWCADPGYLWVDLKRPWPDRLDVRWSAGMTHPTSQHVTACQQEGYWCAEAGWSWVNPENPSANNFAVRWQPGLAIPGYPHVVACSEQGLWCPRSGYQWINPQNPSTSNFGVVWVPGKAIPGYKNVVACPAGYEDKWCPDGGYEWTNPNPSVANFAVQWVPGLAHPSAPHVVSSDPEGNWKPESGYVWVNPSDPSDLRVRPKDPE